MNSQTINIQENKIYFLEYLRIIAFIGVVINHANVSYIHFVLAQGSNINIWQFDYIASNLIYDISRFNTTIFFMVSGALLLNPNYNFNLKKSLIRSVVPLIIWSLLMLVFAKFVLGYNYDVIKIFLTALYYYEHGTIIGHMWYMYTYIGLLLLSPFLRLLVLVLKPTDYLYYLAIFILLNALPNLVSNLQANPYALNYTNNLVAYNLFSFVMGYYLLHVVQKSINKVYLVIMFVVSIIIMYLSSTNYILHTKTFNWIMDNGAVLLQSSALFLMFKQLTFFNKPNKLILQISSLTFLGYLIHKIPLDSIYKILGRSTQSLVDCLVITFLTVIGSLLIAFLVKLITPKKIAPLLACR